jgi:hypothetical protein
MRTGIRDRVKSSHNDSSKNVAKLKDVGTSVSQNNIHG